MLACLVVDHREPWRSQVVARSGMPFSRYRAMRRLQAGPLSGTSLATALDVDAPAASVIVKDLVQRGLASRTTDPSDRRRNVLQLTDEGHALVDELQSSADPVPTLDPLDDQELATLHRLLAKVTTR